MNQLYETTWRNKFLTIAATSIDDMIARLSAAVEELQHMRDAGITLDPDGDTEGDYALLVTSDPVVAEKFGLEAGEDEDELIVE
jgi:hypothetical protein